MEMGVRDSGDLTAAHAMTTKVEAVADLVLDVLDPKGPLPIGQEVAYEMEVTNRGSKEATNVDLVMMFSNGIEPVSADGLNNNIIPGQVQFETVSRINPGETVKLKVIARA